MTRVGFGGFPKMSIELHPCRQDGRGVHMLTHSQDNSHHNHDKRGGYAFSPDGGRSWKLSKVLFISWC